MEVNMMSTELSKLVTRAALLMLALSAAPGIAADTAQNSGFLGDYSKLQPAADNPSVRLWIDKSYDLKPYTKVLLDPVEVWVSPGSEYKGASPDVLKRMSDNFNASFRKALQNGYQLVQKPGPDVLHIKLAITGINLVKPDKNPADFLPIVFILRAATGANDQMNVVLTGEMQVLTPDNRVVAAAVARGTGDQTVVEKQAITWKELQTITDNWAKGLRRRLDEARGVAAVR
jgi:hypothetical protein